MDESLWPKPEAEPGGRSRGPGKLRRVTSGSHALLGSRAARIRQDLPEPPRTSQSRILSSKTLHNACLLSIADLPPPRSLPTVSTHPRVYHPGYPELTNPLQRAIFRGSERRLFATRKDNLSLVSLMLGTTHRNRASSYMHDSHDCVSGLQWL
ncbi:hypothetical protein OH76DRAFT_120086 [Lentinus brumalis]|uniref:Uncharacterized protein n=1 Tax=Lentinus brumalis TaxID=2498619 RepID=A0A371DJI3_9APHY|nr:hypothetical protein OH76DRAFT_120086 [Polyporus brumalis]